MSERPCAPVRTAALDENIVDIVTQPLSIAKLNFTNTGAAPVYLHLFNGPASGQSIADPDFVVAAGASSIVSEQMERMSFPDGLSAALTATEGAADAPSATARVSIGRSAV